MRPTCPWCCTLDHGNDFDQNVRCLRARVTSLMFDGSKLPFEENVAVTARIAQIAMWWGIPVEAELGKVLQAGTAACRMRDVQGGHDQPGLAADSSAAPVVIRWPWPSASVQRMQNAAATELDIARLKETARRRAGRALLCCTAPQG
jgi:hypothetical protein